MSWTEPTPYVYPVVVVWQTVHSAGKEPIRKGRVVVDIRGLNKITEPDSYPMLLQGDVTSLVQGCRFISIMDRASVFQNVGHRATYTSEHNSSLVMMIFGVVNQCSNAPPFQPTIMTLSKVSHNQCSNVSTCRATAG